MRDHNKVILADVVIISAILLLALALRLCFYVGMGPRDDIAYVGLARTIQTDHFHLPQPDSSVFSVRMMIYLPIYLSWKLFGVSEPATCLYFILCALAMIMAGYLIAKQLYGRVEGVLTGVILCFMPLDIVFSSQAMPDLPQAALGGLTILLFLIGKKQQNNGYLVLSGITLAVSVFTKEFAVLYYVILLFFAGHAAMISDSNHIHEELSAFFIIAGTSCVVLFLFWLLYLLDGDPWTPIQIILGNATADKNGNPDQWYYFKLMFNLYDASWGQRYFGIFYYLAAMSFLIVAIWDMRKSCPIFFWFLFYFFFIQWLGPWLTGRPTCERMERFLIPLSLPASLLIARSLGIVWRIHRFSKTAVVVLMIMLSHNLIKTTSSFAYPSEIIHLWDMKRTADLLPKLTRYPIFVDQGSAHKLVFLTSYELDINGYLPNQKNFDHLSKCWVVFDVCDEGFNKGWINSRQIPDHWTEVFRLHGPELRQFENYDAKIYWAP